MTTDDTTATTTTDSATSTSTDPPAERRGPASREVMAERIERVFDWLLEGMTPHEVVRQAMFTFDVKERQARNYLKKARALIEGEATEETRTFHLRHSMLIRERVLRTVLSTLENCTEVDARKMNAVSSLANAANRLLDGSTRTAERLQKSINREAPPLSPAEFRAEAEEVMDKLRANAPPVPPGAPVPRWALPESERQPRKVRAKGAPAAPPASSASPPKKPPATPSTFMEMPTEIYQLIELDINTPPGMEQMHQEAMERMKQQDHRAWEGLQYAIACERLWRGNDAGLFVLDQDPPPRPRPLFRRPAAPRSPSAAAEIRSEGVHPGRPGEAAAMANPSGGTEMRSAPPSWQPVPESARECINPAPSAAARPAPSW